MNVLFVVNCSIRNPYISELVESLRKRHVVDCDVSFFWEPSDTYDVIHIHWPEVLVKWKDVTDEDLSVIASVLAKWHETARIVATVHNLVGHTRKTRRTAGIEKLYDLVYRYADGVINLSETGERLYREKYPHCVESQALTVIPHHIYTSYRVNVAGSSARTMLRIPKGALVVLAFGDVRTFKELRFVVRVFQAISAQSKTLVCPNASVLRNRDMSRKKLLRNPRAMADRILSISTKVWLVLVRHFDRASEYRVASEKVPERDIPAYFAATDILVVPRVESLNSGVVFLGLAFGKRIIGPDVGSIGETLRETQNTAIEKFTTCGIRAAVRRMPSSAQPVPEDVLEMYDLEKASLATTKFYQLVQE